MNNEEQGQHLRKANMRVAIILASLAVTSLVMAGIGVARMISAGA